MLQKQLLTFIMSFLGLLVKYMLQHYSILMLIYVYLFTLEDLSIPGGMVICRVVAICQLLKRGLCYILSHHAVDALEAVLLVHRVFGRPKEVSGTQGGMLGHLGCV